MVLEHADFVSEMVDAIEEDKKVAMDGLLHDLAADRTAKKAELMRSVFIVAVGGTICVIGGVKCVVWILIHQSMKDVLSNVSLSISDRIRLSFPQNTS